MYSRNIGKGKRRQRYYRTLLYRNLWDHDQMECNKLPYQTNKCAPTGDDKEDQQNEYFSTRMKISKKQAEVFGTAFGAV